MIVLIEHQLQRILHQNSAIRSPKLFSLCNAFLRYTITIEKILPWYCHLDVAVLLLPIHAYIHVHIYVYRYGITSLVCLSPPIIMSLCNHEKAKSKWIFQNLVPFSLISSVFSFSFLNFRKHDFPTSSPFLFHAVFVFCLIHVLCSIQWTE